MQADLIDMSFAIEGDPLISNYNMPGLHSEARDAGLELEVKNFSPTLDARLQAHPMI